MVNLSSPALCSSRCRGCYNYMLMWVGVFTPAPVCVCVCLTLSCVYMNSEIFIAGRWCWWCWWRWLLFVCGTTIIRVSTNTLMVAVARLVKSSFWFCCFFETSAWSEWVGMGCCGIPSGTSLFAWRAYTTTAFVRSGLPSRPRWATSRPAQPRSHLSPADVPICLYCLSALNSASCFSGKYGWNCCTKFDVGWGSASQHTGGGSVLCRRLSWI